VRAVTTAHLFMFVRLPFVGKFPDQAKEERSAHIHNLYYRTGLEPPQSLKLLTLVHVH
jgi:hypothetical protein